MRIFSWELIYTAALHYSNRFVQTPLAIFGLAFATASLPAVSKTYVKKDMTALKNSLNYLYGLQFLSFLRQQDL
jgi:peptidoglycan biosynthesis protein MviN/MurJ (putative lipid II flippase)